MSDEFENDGAFNEKLIEDVLSAYPDKFAKRRRKHLTVAKLPARKRRRPRMVSYSASVRSNRISIDSRVMTVRGCAYAGSKGVVWGPVKDMVHISHGPVGCGQYSWSQRRNYYTGTTGIDTFVTMPGRSPPSRRPAGSCPCRNCPRRRQAAGRRFWPGATPRPEPSVRVHGRRRDWVPGGRSHAGFGGA